MDLYNYKVVSAEVGVSKYTDQVNPLRSLVHNEMLKGWQCQGGVTMSVYDTDLPVSNGKGGEQFERGIVYRFAQAMVQPKNPYVQTTSHGYHEGGGGARSKTPTRPSLPRPLPKSRGGNRRTRKSRK